MTGEEILQVDGLRIRVSLRGRGRPLLLLNGLGARLEVLDALRGELEDFETIAFDPPGIGGSELPLWPMRLPAQARLVMRLLDRLGFQRVDLFGVSWGGALAQEIVRRRPARVERLILAGTSPGPFVLTRPSVAAAFFDARQRSSAEYLAHVAPILFGGAVRRDPSILRRSGILRHLERKTSRGYWFQMLAALGWTSLPHLRHMDLPALILAGEDDPLIPAYNARMLARLLPRAEVEVLAGEGHLFVVTSARDTASRIRRFLDRAETVTLPERRGSRIRRGPAPS
jgi:poly(3-hydroxyoctanoate) depolymerase